MKIIDDLDSEPLQMECIKDQWVRPELFEGPPTIIDCGFKYGEFTIPFLKKYGGKAICLEPASESRQIYLNSKDSKLGLDISLHPVALWTKNEKLTFYVLENQMCSNSVFKRKPSPRRGGKVFTRIVDTMTLEDCVEKCGGSVDLLKVDIEGAEWDVFFDTPPEWLFPIKQISMELHTEFSRGRSVQDLIFLLESRGFKMNIKHHRNPKRPIIYGAKL
jgi:FkbM family methyltransferase